MCLLAAFCNNEPDDARGLSLNLLHQAACCLPCFLGGEEDAVTFPLWAPVRWLAIWFFNFMFPPDLTCQKAEGLIKAFFVSSWLYNNAASLLLASSFPKWKGLFAENTISSHKFESRFCVCVAYWVTVCRIFPFAAFAQSMINSSANIIVHRRAFFFQNHHLPCVPRLASHLVSFFLTTVPFISILPIAF